MRATYIGILQPGSTSLMRAESLRALTPGWEWEWIDTHAPMQASARAWRTVAFRYQRGRAVDRINELVASRTSRRPADLVWVDKGVFLRGRTLESIRARTSCLIHFTPDTAFHANRSKSFQENIGLYDLAVTTKSFELDDYHRLIGEKKTLLVTQGFDRATHFPRIADEDRRRGVVFVGLAEPDRERCLDILLSRGIPVRLAGHGWTAFVKRWLNSPALTFEGTEIFGDAYARMLSSSWIGLGLLSKRFPELHTTRTFEIPACQTVLATPQNAETTSFFNESEAIFFGDYEDLAARVSALLSATDTAALRNMAHAGRQRVLGDSRDNDSIIAGILADPRLTRCSHESNTSSS